VAEPSYLAAVRESYDTVAADYAELVKSPTELDPLSRAMLTSFAEVVRKADLGPVADLGCGPGRVTAHLADLGVSALGIDLSPKMIELARQAHPDLSFRVGSMTALPVPDSELGGILAYYSTHHTPAGVAACRVRGIPAHARTRRPSDAGRPCGEPRLPASDIGLWWPPGVLRVSPAATGSDRRSAEASRTCPYRATAPGARRGSEEDDRHLPGSQAPTAVPLATSRLS
jgi:SAM-dependent methyltransferase